MWGSVVLWIGQSWLFYAIIEIKCPELVYEAEKHFWLTREGLFFDGLLIIQKTKALLAFLPLMLREYCVGIEECYVMIKYPIFSKPIYVYSHF
ncbi:Putative protein [Zobellia galactanivorans]|uniref:Uncharacterized protein n=1 Tax=Zobellia galactanivorans (strain DSM 12802 / CCUG 47099 / CIP 106680 / NCIMB 13871 / Dsij) TaxID=63186 RepID=G0L7I2_ZOBGA|nr:Putative protein [Zobellia galactanivorans]